MTATVRYTGLSGSERIALIDRAIDATNAEIGGRLPYDPDDPFPLEHKPLRSLMEANGDDDDDDDDANN